MLRGCARVWLPLPASGLGGEVKVRLFASHVRIALTCRNLAP